MNYTVKPLSPQLAGTFTEYLGGLDFGHAPHWADCFCAFYYSDCSQEVWMNRTGEENRAIAVENINNGTMKGYLAFDGDKCIGWCGANDIHRFIRIDGDLSHITGDRKVGCVICFVIHPEYRGQGVARLLLKKAVEGFREQGFDAVISLPFKSTDDARKQYRGTFNMYRELGFTELDGNGNQTVMWLELKNI